MGAKWTNGFSALVTLGLVACGASGDDFAKYHDPGTGAWEMGTAEEVRKLLIATAHNAGNPKALWEAVRPAVVAMDPMFAADPTGFCTAYGAGDYAPDLLVPRVAPTM